MPCHWNVVEMDKPSLAFTFNLHPTNLFNIHGLPTWIRINYCEKQPLDQNDNLFLLKTFLVALLMSFEKLEDTISLLFEEERHS